MNNLLAAAYEYISKGICVIPTNENKIPAISGWKKYQDEIITIEEAEEGFELPYTKSISVVCGKSSGNLEVIDIDTKYDLTGKLFENFKQHIIDHDKELYDSLLVIQTKSGGYHIYYRCSKVQGNQKLAQRHSSDEEIRKNPHDRIKVLIETRGQGGYVVAPPSNGYIKIQERPIPKITPEQREMLIEIAGLFNEVIEPPKREHSISSAKKEFFTTPWDDFNSRGYEDSGTILDLLYKYDWVFVKKTGVRTYLRRPGKDKGISADYHHDLKLFKVFSTSSIFEAGHAYTHYGVFKMLVCEGDSKRAVKELLALNFGEKRIYYGDKIERDVYRKKSEGLNNDQLTDFLVNTHKVDENEAREIIKNLNKIWGDGLCVFWDINEKGKAVINRNKLIDFLYTHGGFALYYYDKSSTIYRVVQCRDGFLQEATSEYMKKFVIEYIDRLPDAFDGGITPDDLKALILKGHNQLFNEGLLEFLPRGQYNLLKDDIDIAYFPFRNGIIKIDKDNVQLVSYLDVDRVVWKSQIIDFEIRVDPDFENNKIVYSEFIRCISGDDIDRTGYAVTLIGYLLHKYKDPSKPYCIILAEENDNEQKGGGTGKGIFLTALSKLINMERVDGKNFKLDKNFAFQRVGLDTKLVAIEDTRKNVDFEGFYSIITEGITVEKKNKDELFIPYRDSPKIVFTTNYTIINNGVHAKRRQKTFEFAAFFNAEITPVKYFNHTLFDDWDIPEWNLFYNFMFGCCSLYLKAGLLEKDGSLKVKIKHIRQKYGEEFLEWWQEFIDDKPDNHAKNFGKPKMMLQLHREFIQDNGFSDKDYSLKRFKSGMICGTEMFDLRYHIRKNSASGGGREITIFRNDEEKMSFLKEHTGNDSSIPELFSDET